MSIQSKPYQRVGHVKDGKRSDGLSITIARVQVLALQSELEERASDYASSITQSLLVDAGHLMEKSFLRGSTCSDGEGGVRVEWMNKHRDVRLVVPANPDGRMYVYHQDEANHGVDENPSPESLARWLDWLAA